MCKPRHSLAFACLGVLLLTTPLANAYAQSGFSITSTDLRPGETINNAQVFNNQVCHGDNRSPQLSWRNAPAGTRSFALTLWDKDAPGHGWWHWAVADIPANVDTLPTNASASGFLRKFNAVEARNDFDTVGYAGPCPPPGTPHRYIITLYALKVASLHLPAGRPALMFDHEIGTVALGSTHIVVSYGR